MDNLESIIREVSNRIQVIPPSRGYWVNRTEDGHFYEPFLDKSVVGLNINDVPLSILEKIRKDNSFPNKRLNYEKALEDLQIVFQKKYERELRETHDKQKKTNLRTKISLKTSQVFNFVYKVKAGDYIAIPSKNSENISIGRVENSYLDNSDVTFLQRSVSWIGTFKKYQMDPMIFKAFNSHLAFYDVIKYRDAILRTLYDFYFEGEEGNFVLNLGEDDRISFIEETRFLYTFNELFSEFITKKELSYDLRELSTIVNLNSKGKRKLFGNKELTFLAALFLCVAIEGDTMTQKKYSKELNYLISEINSHLILPSDSGLSGKDLKNAAEDMNVDKQEFFKKILDNTNSRFSELEEKQKKINSYY